MHKICYPLIFPSFIIGFCTFSFKVRTIRCQNSGPLLFAVLVFAGYYENVTLANNENRLYCKTDVSIQFSFLVFKFAFFAIKMSRLGASHCLLIRRHSDWDISSLNIIFHSFVNWKKREQKLWSNWTMTTPAAPTTWIVGAGYPLRWMQGCYV